MRLACTDLEWIRYDRIFTTWQCGGNYFKHLLLPAFVLLVAGDALRGARRSLPDLTRRAGRAALELGALAVVAALVVQDNVPRWSFIWFTRMVAAAAGQIESKALHKLRYM